MVAWSDPGFGEVIRLLRECAGLSFPPTRQRLVEGAIQRAMVRAGVRDATRFAALMKEETLLREDLLTELTVGETYFFREPAQLEFLRREVVPQLLRHRGPQLPIRIWSAGCASGEEPYTLAILCAQAGVLGSVQIVGTELSRQRLETARRARYGRWSFRGVSTDVIDTYFERRGAHFELDRRIRSAVDFRVHNLVGAPHPSPDPGSGPYDLILCRNVLIYFDLATVTIVAQRLLDSLADDGFLLLGASDPLLTELVPCTAIMTGSGLIYRRAGQDTEFGSRRRRPSHSYRQTSAPAAATPSAAITPLPPLRTVGDGAALEPPISSKVASQAEPAYTSSSSERLIEIQTAYLAGDYSRAAELASTAIEAGPEGEDDGGIWVLWVRALANQGRLDEAGRVCARALDGQRLSGELAYLHAVLLLQARHPAQAAAAARRALYLDRSLIVAHLIYARALEELGESQAALRALQNAQRLLNELDPATAVPASDGVLAGYMREVVRTQIRFHLETN